MSPREFITKKIIYPIKTMGKSLSKAPKKSASIVSLISVVGVLSSLLLLYIPSKIGIVGFSAYAPQQPQQNSLDQISSSLEIAQSKVQAATALGAWGLCTLCITYQTKTF
jgi:hypothetical protein